MSFKKYVEAADLAESWFGRLRNRLFNKKPAAPPKKEVPELEIIHKSTDMARGISKDDRKGIDDMNRRFEAGNLYKALQDYNVLIEKTGQHYPDKIVRRISQSQRVNDIWDKQYREMYLKMGNTPALKLMLLQKAFSDMGLPPTQSITPPYEVVPEPPQNPSFEEIVDYIKLLLTSEVKMNKNEIRRRVKEKFPALEKADSRIGMAMRKATTSSLKLYEPPAEDKPRKKGRKNNILKFPGTEE